MNQIKTSLLTNASGPLEYRLTNDYLFRALLQRNNKVLKALISSLLHLDIKAVRSVEITNPIVLGEAIDNKTFVLDIRVLLNDSTVINLEMQVANEQNWTDRSLCYLCRTFDALEKGETYQDVKPVIHISFLDFTLFEDHPEFYATYMFLNVKNHTLYSDKLRLSVVELNQIELATDEDKQYGIDYWAALFKAKTWEEIKMLAEKNEYLNEASETMRELVSEETIRDMCFAREQYEKHERTVKRDMDRLNTALAEKDAALTKKDAIITEKDAVITEKDAALTKKDAVITEKDAAIAQKNAMLAEQDSLIAQLQERIKELEK